MTIASEITSKRPERVVTERNASVFDRALRWQLVELAQERLNTAASKLPEVADVYRGYTVARERWASAHDVATSADTWRACAQAQGALNVRAITTAALADESRALEAALLAYHALYADGSPALDRQPGVGGLS